MAARMQAEWVGYENITVGLEHGRVHDLHYSFKGSQVAVKYYYNGEWHEMTFNSPADFGTVWKSPKTPRK